MRSANARAAGEVELRQGRQIPPAFIIGLALVGVQGEAMHLEPIQVGRLRAAFKNMVKLEKTAAGVVKDPVQHHAQPALVGFFQQALKGGRAAQQRIHLKVIVGVVAVIGRGLKHRGKVKRVDAQVLQVIQVFTHPQQVAAFEPPGGGRRVPGFQVVGFGQGRAVSEAVRKDLVKNGVMHPGGCRENSLHADFLSLTRPSGSARSSAGAAR